MEALQIRDFRQHLGATLDRAAKGEEVLIKRHNEYFVLSKVEREDLTITPELQERIDKARKDYEEGKCITCHNEEELQAFFDSL